MLALLVVCVAIVVFAATTAYGQGFSDYLDTSVELDRIPSTIHAGDRVTFTGTLTSTTGSPLPDRTVWICEDDPFVPDDCIARGTTDRSGRFAISWTAEAGTVEIDFDIYAEFDGDAGYWGSQSPRQIMSVLKYGGSIVLDSIPDSAAFGEAVTFSGTLVLEGHGTEGAIVYIKDEDTFNPDDLLASAYVDGTGRFTTYWIAQDVDPTSTVEIQAVFEGNDLYRRIASPIQEMRTYAGQLPPPSTPAAGEGYMELYHSLDFGQAPLIHIVPSPDSYETVRKHIAPVQEGILQLTAMIEHAYPDGDWNVAFEVVEPGQGFVGSKPDITVNLVTSHEDEGCGVDYAGWALPTRSKPVQTVVCSLADSTNEDIGATAMHEFIHAVGVGHTFNIRGDLLCSVEDGGPTCPDLYSRSNEPSSLNLAAIVATYGTDGFTNPNNWVSYRERFTVGDYQNQRHLESPDPNYPIAGSYTGSIHADQARYEPGETILVNGFYWQPYDGQSRIIITGPNGGTVDELSVSVVGDFFEARIGGYDLPGAYAASLYDSRGWFVTSTTFHVVDGTADAESYAGFIYTDYIWYYPGEPVLIDGFYWEPYDGRSTVVVVDPDGYVVDEITVDVQDDFFAASTAGHYLPGTYVVWLFSDQPEFVSGTAFHIVDLAAVAATSTYSGSVYADSIEYHPGETVLVGGYYWDEQYYASSTLLIMGPDGDVVDELHVTGSDFEVTAGEYHLPGIYTALLYDHQDNLVASYAFRIIDVTATNQYDGLLFTDYIWYYPGEPVLIDGFYWESYNGPSTVTVLDPDGYVVDELTVGVKDDFFVAGMAGYYLSGAYAVWLFNDQGEFVSSTAFHVLDDG